MKKILTAVFALFLCMAALGAVGCDTDGEQALRRTSLAVLDHSGKEWCVLTEQDCKGEVEFPFDGTERSFRTELRAESGAIPAEQAEISAELLEFVPADGGKSPAPDCIREEGTYIYWFSVSGERIRPFQAFLTIRVIAETDAPADELVFGENTLSLQPGEHKDYLLPRGEKVCTFATDVQGLEISVWNETKTAEYPLYGNGNASDFYCGADANTRYVVQIENTSASALSDAAIVLRRGGELTLDAPSEIGIFSVRYLYFTPESDGYYEIACDGGNIAAYVENETAEEGGYLLNGGTEYVIRLSADGKTDGTVTVQKKLFQLSLGKNFVTGQILRFTPEVTNIYTFTFSENLKMLISEGKETVLSGKTYSAELTEGADYCFLFEESANLHGTAEVGFQAEDLQVGETKNITLSESGYAFFRVSVGEETPYKIISAFGTAVYNSALKRIGDPKQTRWAKGVYYVRAEGSALAEGSILVKLTGFAKEIGDKISVSQTSYYSFTLEAGREYVLSSTGNEYDTTEKTFAVFDGGGNLIAEGEGVTEIPFTAATEDILVKVTLEIEGHTIGFRILEKTETTAASA